MAEKHKSKYKSPKDFEKSQKPKPRKDLKDYTEDDKKGGQNPHSTGDAQLNVLRKRDKEMVDTGDMYVKYNDDDRLYKDIETGDYDPKTAAKRLKKRQDTEEKETKDVIKDKIENLTREQKERLVREYVRKKMFKILVEQPTDTTEEPVDTAVTDTTTETPPAADAAVTPTPDVTAATDTTTPPAATDTTTPPAATDTTTPPAATDTATQATPEELENRAITSAANELSKEGSIGKIKALSKMLNLAMKEVDPEDQHNFYKLLRSFSIKKISSIQPDKTNK
jgi:hypothetical protein